MAGEDFAGSGPTGGFNAGGGSGFFGRMFSGNRASTVSAGLKFDIPGLQQFKRELDNIKTSVNQLRDAFKDMGKQSAELAKVNAELAKMQAHLKGVSGSGGVGSVSGGTPGGGASFSGVGGGGGSSGLGGMLKGLLGGGGGGGMGGGGGAAAGAGAIGSLIGAGVSAGFNRVGAIKSYTQDVDPIASRLGLYTGVSPQRYQQNLGRTGGPGGLPFLGNSGADFAQAQLSLASMGAVQGAGGLAGQRFGAAAQSIQMLQNMRPGTSAAEGANSYASFASNIQGQRQGQIVFGAAAMMGTKNQAQYFQGIMRGIVNNFRTGNKKGVPYTKDELYAIMTPGSTIHTHFSLLGWSDDQVNQFFEWALSNASTTGAGGGAFTGTEAQSNQVRGGRSVTTERQQTASQRLITEASAAGATYGGQLAGEDLNQAMLRVQKNMETLLGGIYNTIAKTGSLGGKGGGLAKVALGGAVALGLSAIGMPEIGIPLGVGIAASGAGDPMDMGDTLGSVNPDVRKRVQAMMQANPNLKVASGYRTHNQQKALYESGRTGAQPGKSQHGRGQAVDIGPRSQYGWIQANAKKFGLDQASKYGEPWHVQVAGTMQAGDPTTSETDSRANWLASAQAFNTGLVGQQLARLAAGGGGASAAAAGTGSPSGSVSGSNAAEPTVATGTPSGGTLTAEEIAKYAYNAGFRGDDLVKMVAIARRESGGNFGTIIHDKDDWGGGLWGLNTLGMNLSALGGMARNLGYQIPQGAGEDVRNALFDVYKTPEGNAKMAKAFFDQGGYKPWQFINSDGSRKSETWNTDIPAAEAAVHAAGLGDPVAGGGRGGGNVSVSGGYTFMNTFNITVQGGTPDVEGLTRSIALRLESQMQRITQTSRR